MPAATREDVAGAGRGVGAEWDGAGSDGDAYVAAASVSVSEKVSFSGFVSTVSLVEGASAGAVVSTS